jgi:hypothetical protein
MCRRRGEQPPEALLIAHRERRRKAVVALRYTHPSTQERAYLISHRWVIECVDAEAGVCSLYVRETSGSGSGSGTHRVQKFADKFRDHRN